MSLPAFQAWQLALTAHLRNPDDGEQLQNDRLAVYTDLIFNNANSFLESTFPVLRRIVKKKLWQRTVRGWLCQHRSHYPLFRHIPLSFLEYLVTLDLEGLDLPPFTVELAHHEWLELKLDVDARRVRWPSRPQLSPDVPLRINPVLELHAYRYPVHALTPSFQPHAPVAEPVFLLTWRNRQHRVCFRQLNAGTARLLHALQHGSSASAASVQLGLQPDGGDSREALGMLLSDWLAADIIVGRKRLQRWGRFKSMAGAHHNTVAPNSRTSSVSASFKAKRYPRDRSSKLDAE